MLEIEAIEDRKGKGNKVKYYVKWKGSKIKTWEPSRQGVFRLADGWIQELKDDNELQVEKVEAINNAANILTKAMQAAAGNFRCEARLIGGQWARGHAGFRT